mmetsp:Transcript_22844/g.57764  ORF Transcript_22844/g.57764 Transcript_22844/m.57764 type:complete len:331 (+) Transcript_22844:113-1105(+)|eukprot:CAMPEP_0178991682 /NCGR_PEP_ID=MMETSP0795-20121207/5669_1 /TAXON_ID=88552 /ORGANISM="Amoebophrya sp., Strain Ameob2" /LENGTH=330 /DNA_ID=CAMNT_0020683429 /DNA_START=88 /DNA_END=1080 /DNA_ORIENTATION=-
MKRSMPLSIVLVKVMLLRAGLIAAAVSSSAAAWSDESQEDSGYPDDYIVQDHRGDHSHVHVPGRRLRRGNPNHGVRHRAAELGRRRVEKALRRERSGSTTGYEKFEDPERAQLLAERMHEYENAASTSSSRAESATTSEPGLSATAQAEAAVAQQLAAANQGTTFGIHCLLHPGLRKTCPFRDVRVFGNWTDDKTGGGWLAAQQATYKGLMKVHLQGFIVGSAGAVLGLCVLMGAFALQVAVGAQEKSAKVFRKIKQSLIENLNGGGGPGANERHRSIMAVEPTFPVTKMVKHYLDKDAEAARNVVQKRRARVAVAGTAGRTRASSSTAA